MCKNTEFSPIIPFITNILRKKMLTFAFAFIYKIIIRIYHSTYSKSITL